MLHLRENPVFVDKIVVGIEKICQAKNIKTCPQAIRLVVKNNLSRPDNPFTYNENTRKQELMKLTDECLAQLQVNDPKYKALYKLQVCLNEVCGKEVELIDKYKNLMEKTLEPLRKVIAILEPKKPEDIEKIADLLTKHALMSSSVGNLENLETLGKTKSVLKSILDHETVTKFRSEPLDSRMKTISDISNFLAGVLLFKEVCTKRKNKKGNSYFHAGKMKSLLDTVQNKIMKTLLGFKETNLKLSNFIGKTILWTYDGRRKELHQQIPQSMTKESYEDLCYNLLMQHQVITYLKLMERSVVKFEQLYDRWITLYTQKMNEVIQKGYYTDVIRSPEVQPLFIELAELNNNFSWGSTVLECMVKVYVTLVKYFKVEEIINDLAQNSEEDLSKSESDVHPDMSKAEGMYPDLILLHLAALKKEYGHVTKRKRKDLELGQRNEGVKTLFSRTLFKVSPIVLETPSIKDIVSERKIRNFSMDDKTLKSVEKISQGEEFERYYTNLSSRTVQASRIHIPAKELVEDVDKSCLFFNGFDPVVFVEGQGLLLHADSNSGYFPILKGFIGFTSKDSANLFAKSSLYYLTHLIDFVRINPIYIEVLQLRKFLEPLMGIGWLYTEERECNDWEVETGLAEEAMAKKKGYQHSRWMANAAVIKMANIQNMKTKSSQVDLVQYRCYDQAVQTVELKEDGNQPPRPAYTNTATPSVWRHGLMPTADEATTVELTLAPEEESYLRLIRPTATQQDPDGIPADWDYLGSVTSRPKGSLPFTIISLLSASHALPTADPSSITTVEQSMPKLQ